MNSQCSLLRAVRAALLCACASLGACALDSSAEPGSDTCFSGVGGASSAAAACRSAAGTAGAGADGDSLSIAAVLSDKGGEYVDGLARDAVPLPAPVTAILREFMALDGFPSAFTNADLQRVRILPGRQPGAGQFMRGGQAAITLDSLVIFEDTRYDALIALSASWDDVLSGALTPAQDRGLFTLVHELVHVRQFRELGRERFLSEYLADVVSRGQQSVELEQDAYAVAPGNDSWSRTAIAAAR